MSKAELTRQYIIEKVAPIFNMKGFAGTSLTDLIDATKLTKGSIYGNFENKNEVAIAVYKFQVRTLNKRIADFIRDKKTSGDKLRGITEFYRVNWKHIFTHGGCPILNAAIESDDNISFLKKDVQVSIERWARSIALIIEDGKISGEFNSKISSQDYAYTIITLLEGGMLMGKTMNNHKLLYSSLDRIDGMIKSEIEK